MLGTVDILDDENGTDTTATTNSTTTTTDADHVFMSFKIACMYVYMYVCMYVVLGRMKFRHCPSLQYSVHAAAWLYDVYDSMYPESNDPIHPTNNRHKQNNIVHRRSPLVPTTKIITPCPLRLTIQRSIFSHSHCSQLWYSSAYRRRYHQYLLPLQAPRCKADQIRHFAV